MKGNNLNSSDPINIEKCRKIRSYKFREYILRILWKLISPLFFLSPRVFFSWRTFLLRLFGAKIGKKVHIYPSARIYLPWNLSIDDYSCVGEWSLIYNLGFISIGKSVTISHNVHLCGGTHDYENENLKLIKKNISIDNFAWLCSDAYIGPGCNIGEGAIVGARSVAIKNVNSWEIVGGNPAKLIKKRKMQNDI